MEQVPKTQDEIDREIEIVNSRMIANGMPPEMANWEPDPYRNMVGSIFVDGHDRIWIARGTVLTPFFDVFDIEGNPLFTAAVDPDLDFMYTGVIVSDHTDGFLAFNPDPDDYPVVYVLELEGLDQ